ncbi:MAG: hypothetical protein RIR59_1672, partial [Pseudomonadota bacterium]
MSGEKSMSTRRRLVLSLSALGLA